MKSGLVIWIWQSACVGVSSLAWGGVGFGNWKWCKCWCAFLHQHEGERGPVIRICFLNFKKFFFLPWCGWWWRYNPLLKILLPHPNHQYSLSFLLMHKVWQANSTIPVPTPPPHLTTALSSINTHLARSLILIHSIKQPSSVFLLDANSCFTLKKRVY